MKHNHLALCITLILCCSSLAQTNIKFHTLSPKGGLYYDGVKNIRQDSIGFIWIVMDNNFYRFDGYDYKPYKQLFKNFDDSEGWVFNNIDLDNSGNLYISTSKGLYKYNNISDSFVEQMSGQTYYIYIDRNNNIWVRNTQGLGRFDSVTATLNYPLFEGEPLKNSATLYAEKDDDLYTFSGEGHIYKYNKNKNQFELAVNLNQYFSKDPLKSVQIYGGELWLLSASMTLYKIDLSTFHITYTSRYRQTDNISTRHMHISSEGLIWIATIDGLYIFNPQNEQYTHYQYSLNNEFSIPHNSVWTISEDKQKNIWIGTYTGSVAYVNKDERNAFTSYTSDINGLSHIPVSGFAEEGNKLWVATEGGGLNVFDKKSKSFEYYKHLPKGNSLSHNNTKSLLSDKNGNIWVSTFNGGLDCFSPSRGTFKNFRKTENQSQSLYSNSLRKIALEADSGLWIAYQTQSVVISYLSLYNNEITHFTSGTAENDLRKYIYDLYRGRDNKVWFITADHIYSLDVVSKQMKSYIIDKAKYPYATTLCMDDNGNIWIGTSGNGLIKFEPEKETFTPLCDVLKGKATDIYSINYENGNIWMGTNNGLLRYNIETKQLSVFKESDGIQGNVYYPLATMKGKNNLLYFGGTNGFTIIDTRKVTLNPYRPHAIISDFYIDNKPILGNDIFRIDRSGNMEKEIILSHEQMNFGFKISSDNFLLPQKNSFRYRLKGFDDRWINSDASTRIVQYSKINPGTYYFEVQAANNDNVWGDTITSIKIIRKAPFWASWTAYILYSAMSLLLIVYLVRSYRRKRRLKLQMYIEHLENEKKAAIHQAQQQFFTNITHDFRTPLSLILATTDRMREEGLKEYYYKILNSNSRRLFNLVNEVMDFRKIQDNQIKLAVEYLNLNKFIENIACDFKELANQKNIKLGVILNDPALNKVLFDRRIMEKILMNLLNNAFKYTKDGGQISVSAKADVSSFKSEYANSFTIGENSMPDKSFFIAVQDTGVGITKDSMKKVFDRYYQVKTMNTDNHLGEGIGLALVKSLVLLHKGCITIYSKRDKGSDFVVQITNDIQYYKSSEFAEDQCAIKGDEGLGLFESEVAIDVSASASIELENDSLLKKENKTILIVEDNVDLRTLIGDMLRQRYCIAEAGNGIEGLEQIEANNNIDLIISDIMMPRMDGITFCLKVKNQMETSHIPFILLSAKSSIESKMEGAESGADIYIEKPVDLQLLEQMIENVFSRQEKLRQYFAQNFYAEDWEVTVNKQDNQFMKNFVNLIEQYIDDPSMDINFIASEMSMSRSKLYNKIKTLTGKSIVEFILSYRLRRAAKLILEKNVNMREAMAAVGIESQSYFTNAFKKEFGETPTKFAARYKNKD